MKTPFVLATKHETTKHQHAAVDDMMVSDGDRVSRNTTNRWLKITER